MWTRVPRWMHPCLHGRCTKLEVRRCVPAAMLQSFTTAGSKLFRAKVGCPVCFTKLHIDLEVSMSELPTERDHLAVFRLGLKSLFVVQIIFSFQDCYGVVTQDGDENSGDEKDNFYWCIAWNAWLWFPKIKFLWDVCSHLFLQVETLYFLMVFDLVWSNMNILNIFWIYFDLPMIFGTIQGLLLAIKTNKKDKSSVIRHITSYYMLVNLWSNIAPFRGGDSQTQKPESRPELDTGKDSQNQGCCKGRAK